MSSIAVVAILGVLLLAGSAAFFVLRSGGSNSPAAVPGALDEPALDARDGSEPRVTLTRHAGGFYRSSSNLYYRGNASSYGVGANPAEGGQDAQEYTVIAGADPSTFSEIRTVTVPGPYADSAPAQATYYHDDDQVFIAVGVLGETSGTISDVQSVIADEDSFQVLSDTYAKDDTYVYIVSWVCDGEECVLVLEVVEGADPNSFHAFEATQMQQSDGSGSVVADAADDSYVYYEGEVVDTIVQPGSYVSDALYIHGP